MFGGLGRALGSEGQALDPVPGRLVPGSRPIRTKRGPERAAERRSAAVPPFLRDWPSSPVSKRVSGGGWCDGIVSMRLSARRSRAERAGCDGIRAERVCRHNHRFPLVIAGLLLSPLPSQPCDSKTARSAPCDGILGHGVG